MSQNIGDNPVVSNYYASESGISCYLDGVLFNPTSLHIIANETITFTKDVGLESYDDENVAYVIFEAPKIILNTQGGYFGGIYIKDNGYNRLTFNNASVNFDNASYNVDPLETGEPTYQGPIAFTGTSSINVTSNTNGKTIIKASTLTGTVSLDVESGVQDGDTFLIEATDNQLVITDGEWIATPSTSGNITTYTLSQAQPVPTTGIGFKKQLRRKLALMLANLKKKRPYYCEVEYLESSGTQYIDTGLNYFADFEVCIKLRNNVANKALGNTATNCLERNNATAHNWRFSSNGSWDSNIDILEYHIMKWKEDKIYADDVLLTEKVKNKNVGYNMTLFGVGSYYPNMIYFCKLWNPNDGTLVRDFIPVLDWDMTPCMYDKVSGQLFYNQGTGDFIAGREIHPVDYLESTGTQWIDTDTTFQVTDEAYFKGALLTRSNDKFVLSAQPWNNNNNRYSPLGYYANKLVAAFGNIGTQGSYYTPEQNDSEVHTITYKNKVFTMEDTGATYSAPSTALFGGETGKIKFFYGYNAPSVARIYAYKQWRDGELICDFIPAIDSEGRGFMFDRVTHTIYDNAGTGAFKYPARETEYIEVTDLGTNNQNPCIDLGLKYKPSMSIEAKYTRTGMGVSGSILPLSNSTTHPLIYMPALNASSKTDRFVWRRPSLPEASYYYAFEDYPMTVEFKVDAVNDALTINDNVVKTGMIASMNGYTDPYESYSNLYMLSINGTYGGMGKVYYLKLYDTTQVYRDLIPVWKDGVACVYDKQNNTYYSNTKTGTVICGKIVEPEYE